MKHRSILLVITVIAVGFISSMKPAQATPPYKVYGSEFAWVNYFGNNVFGYSFGSGSTANLTVSYNVGTGNLYGYPAAVQGWHYGFNPAGSTKYPKQIKNLGTDSAWFSWSSGGSNMHGDFAYDLFLRSDSAKSSPQLEVMIWGKNNSWPIGTKVASNTVNGMDLWAGNNSAAGYYVYSFVPAGTGGGSAWGNGTSGSLNVNITSFLNYLCSHYGSRVNTNWYLDVVEGGIEVTGGNGWSWFQMSN